VLAQLVLRHVAGAHHEGPQSLTIVVVAHTDRGDLPHQLVGDDDYGQRLRAFVVRTGDVSEDELREHVRANLARFKVPREIVFVDELPRNATGKVLKRELAEWDEDPKDGEEPA